MKNLRIMIDTAGRYTTIQIRYGKKCAVACKEWKNKAGFPFITIAQCIYKLIKQRG